MITIKNLNLPGLKLIIPKMYLDTRGFFFESYKDDDYKSNGVVGNSNWVQENHSRYLQRVIRGLHYQENPGQTKLVRCAYGAIIDVVVDIRVNSPTFGQHEKVFLDGASNHQLLVPVGFAHGFCCLSANADVLYKVDSYYNSEEEKTLQWNDSDLNIDWEINEPIVSERDKKGQSFAEYKQEHGC